MKKPAMPCCGDSGVGGVVQPPMIGSADAQDRYRRGYSVPGERTLTVNRRSFLDPGPVVPQYTRQRYVLDQIYFNKTPDQAYQPGKFDFGHYYGP